MIQLVGKKKKEREWVCVLCVWFTDCEQESRDMFWERGPEVMPNDVTR